MKIFKDEIKIEEFQSNIINEYFGNMKYAVFDIETTGLSPKWCKIILAGFTYHEDGKLIAKQILAENRSEEKELLATLSKELSNFDYVVTYNGRQFDIPFICNRYNHYGMFFDSPYDLDIYHMLRYYSDLRTVLPNMRQKTMEEYMGISEKRTDEISGADSIALYEEYEATQDPKLERVINLHNFDDIVQLYKLQPALLKTDLHKAFFGAGFPVKSKSLGTLEICKIKFNGAKLFITGEQHNGEGLNFTKYEDFENDIRITMNGNLADFEIVISVHREPAGIYVNLNDFLNDDADFKSLNGYVKGSLILMDKTRIQYEETNKFVKRVLEAL